MSKWLGTDPLPTRMPETMTRYIFIIFSWLVTSCSLFTNTNDELLRVENYSLTTPNHWQKSKIKKSDYAFTLPSHAQVQFISSCEEQKGISKDNLLRQLLIGIHTKNIEKKTINTQLGELLLAQVKTQSDSKPVSMTIFIFLKFDCVFDVIRIHSTPPSTQEIQEIVQVIESIHHEPQ